MMLKIVIGALGLVAGVTATPLEIIERSSCRDDSLYKCFADYEYAHSASAYCSALAPCTKTVTAVKPTVTKTAWKTLTAATSTCLVKSTTTVYTRTIPSSTVVKTSTHVETKTSTATATVTASSQIIELKRAVGAAKPQPPNCMLNKCFAYTPERITAACSCINVPPKTITATHTACSTTKTVTSTSTITPKITATSWHTVATALTNGVTTTCTTTTITTTVTTTTTTTTTTPATVAYTTPATTPATTSPTTPSTTPATTPPTTPPTTTATTPATAPITTAAATTSPAAPNLVPNGDFASGPWTQINSSPAAWVNPNVNEAHSPDGTSPDFAVTNVIPTGQFLVASSGFPLQDSSTFTLTFYASNTATDLSWLNRLKIQINCGSITVAQPDMTKATVGPNNYMVSSTTFNTPTNPSASTLQQLQYCQVQMLLQSGVAVPNTWFLADVGVSYVGPIALTSSAIP